MQEHDELSPADREVVESLHSLVPAAVRIDSVAAAYAAGRRSARNQVQWWRAAAAVLLVAGSASWLVPAAEHHANSYRPQPAVASHSAPASVARPSAQSLVALQYAVYQQGIEAMPTTQIPAARTVRPGDLF